MDKSLSNTDSPPILVEKTQEKKGKGYRAKKPLGCEFIDEACPIPSLLKKPYLLGRKEYFECGYPISRLYNGFYFKDHPSDLKFKVSNYDLKVITPVSIITFRNFFKMANWRFFKAYFDDAEFIFGELIKQKVKSVNKIRNECHNFCDRFMVYFDLRMVELLVYTDTSPKDAKPCNEAARTHRRKCSELAFFTDQSDTPSTSERIHINRDYLSTVISVASQRGVQEVWATFGGQRQNIYRLNKNTAPITSFDVNDARIFLGYNKNKTALIALPCPDKDIPLDTLKSYKGQEFQFGIEVIERDGTSTHYPIHFYY